MKSAEHNQADVIDFKTKNKTEYKKNGAWPNQGITIDQDPWKPEKLKLPPTPKPEEIKKLREWEGLTVIEAAEQVGVTGRTWQRWETGQSAMPQSHWAWFKMNHEHFNLGIFAGEKWDGWHFYQGLLITPEGDRFNRGQIRGILSNQSINSCLEVDNRKMKEVVKAYEEDEDWRAKARGQIDMMGLLTSILAHEYETEDNPLLSDVGYDMKQMMMTMGSIKAKLIKKTEPRY